MSEEMVAVNRDRTAVFLSYSRKDTPFLQRLASTLETRGYEPVFDRSERSNADPDMLLTAQDEWWAALKSMIAACDVMVFIVTPHSAASPVCNDEIAHARALGKRIIAVLRGEIDFGTAPERLRALNVKISFCSDDDTAFAISFEQLCTELDADIDWHRRGARLTRLANQWEKDGRPKGQLLRAGAISYADAWAARRPGGAPEPGELLLAFLAASRELEVADRNNLLKGVANGFAVRAEKASSESRFIHAAKCVGAAAVLCDDLNFGIDRAVHAWRLGARSLFEAAHVVLNIEPHPVVDAQWSPDGGMVATASSTDGCRLWDASTGQMRHFLQPTRGGASSCRFSECGYLLVVACKHGAVQVFDVVTGRHISDFGYHEGGANFALFTPGSFQVVSAGRDCVIRVWDYYEGREIAELHGHTGDILYVDLSRDGKFIASSGQDGRPRSWSMSTYKEISRPDCKSLVITDGSFPGTSATFSSDMHSILSGSATGEVAIWDVQTGKTRLFQQCHKDATFNPTFSPNGQMFATPGFFDYVAKVWDANSGELVTDLEGHRCGIWNVVFSPDGGRIATSDVDGEVRLWDANNGDELRRLLGHHDNITSIAFSPDGRKLLTASRDGTTRIWDASCGAMQSKVSVENGLISDIYINSNSGYLTTTGKDKRGRLWTLSGDLIATLGDGNDHPQILKFSTNGEWLIFAERGKPVAVHRSEDGVFMRNLSGALEWEDRSFVSPNSRFVFLRHKNGWVCVDASCGSVSIGQEVVRFIGQDESGK